MRIQVESIILCSGVGRENPIDLQIDTEFGHQLSRPIRREYGRVLPAFTKFTNISFSVSRQHASPQDAEVFCLTHESTIPTSGNSGGSCRITLAASSSSGFTTQKTMTGQVTNVSCSHVGASSTTRYSLKGGDLI